MLLPSLATLLLIVDLNTVTAFAFQSTTPTLESKSAPLISASTPTSPSSSSSPSALYAVYDPSKSDKNNNNNNKKSNSKTSRINPTPKTFVLKKVPLAEQKKQKAAAANATRKISSTNVNAFFKQKNSGSDDGKANNGPGKKAAGENAGKKAAAKSAAKPVASKPKGMQNFFSTFSLSKSEPQPEEKSADTAPSAKTSPSPKATKTKPDKFFMQTTPIQKLNAKSTSTSTSSSSTTSTTTTSTQNFMSKITSPLEKLNLSPSSFTNTQPQAKSLQPGEEIITNDVTGFTTTIINSDPKPLQTLETNNEPKQTKFTFEQRIESIKTGLVGLFAGGIALTPFSALHDIVLADESIANGVAQWEFDTDTGSIAAALFAIVYRYCVRDGEEENEMLQMGVIGAFVVVRTLSKIRVPVYCSSAPLDCGDPLGYFDYNMIQQGIGSGLESVVMFGAAALAMEYCYNNGYISRFK
jgi:hypothetical protein